MEGKVLRLNVDKTKGMQLLFGKKSSVSKVDPCGFCVVRVACNSAQCTKCHRWVHRRCSNVTRQVSLLSCRDVFVCKTSFGHNCSVEKFEFKRGDDVLQEAEKCYYMGDMISCYGGASEAVSSRIGSAWKFTKLSGVLVGKQGLYSKQRGKIYQCCVRPALLYCCKTWQHTVADEARLCGMERRMIRMMVDRMSTDVFLERLDVVVKIKEMIIQSCLHWYEHVMRGDINSQIREVMEVEIAGKRKKSRSRELKECVGSKEMATMN